jgi:molybdenum cofactor synthesis domain-containing protein
MRAAVLTVSTSVSAGAAEDLSGPALAELARDLGAADVTQEVVSDDRERLESRLRHWADAGCALVLTTGGTGFAPSDVTPEATRAVIERDAPGIPEAMRAASREHTEHWMLSRAAAGVRGATLIVNFPGSPASIRQTGEALAPGLRHALQLLAGGRPHGHGHARGGA